MKILSSSEAFAYKQQLAVIRDQMRLIEERGVYDIAGNIVKPSDRKEYADLKKMENHVQQLGAGIEYPLPLERPKHNPEKRRKPLTDAEWKELAEWAHEAFKAFRGCTDTNEKEKSSEDTVEARETHVTGGD